LSILKLNINNYSGWLKVLARVLLLSMLILMTYGTLSSDPGTPSGAAPFLHFGGMAWIAFLACASFDTLRSRAGAVVFVFAYSALMELFQHYLPYRHGTWEDVMVNGLGCVVGVGIFVATGWIGELREYGFRD
jgi:VanZ family protein